MPESFQLQAAIRASRGLGANFLMAFRTSRHDRNWQLTMNASGTLRERNSQFLLA
jgi:hypothetical protein